MTDVEAIEPDLDQVWVIDDPRAPPPPFAAAPPSCDRPEPQERGVLPHVERFAWHLEGDFSGLKAARDAIARSRRKVTIAHLDTGYLEGRQAAAGKFRPRAPATKTRTMNRDPGIEGLLRNPGHGMGTLGILAGGPGPDRQQPEDRHQQRPIFSVARRARRSSRCPSPTPLVHFSTRASQRRSTPPAPSKPT